MRRLIARLKGLVFTKLYFPLLKVYLFLYLLRCDLGWNNMKLLKFVLDMEIVGFRELVYVDSSDKDECLFSMGI